MRHTRRGFTLLEVMVSVVIGAISVAVATKVAQVVIQQSARGRERTDFHARAQSFTRQLRADIRTAGLGSSGAIAFASPPPIASIVYSTDNLYFAMPAVTGANNVPAIAIGTGTSQPGSDFLQLVVPDPSTAVRSTGFGRAGTGVMQMEPFNAGADPLLPAAPQAVPPCATNPAQRLIYIIDNTAPNGSGRAMLAYVSTWDATGLTIINAFPFTISPGARVMCARISTYWVDDQGWFHRSDFNRRGQPVDPIPGSLVMVDSAASVNDTVSPGVDDFQVAFAMSADVQRRRGLPLDPTTRHVFAPGGMAAPAAPNLSEWADVRQVRFNVLSRTLRKVISTSQAVTLQPREDGPVPPVRSRGHGTEWVTSTEVLMSLKLYDESAPQNTVADPF